MTKEIKIKFKKIRINYLPLLSCYCICMVVRHPKQHQSSFENHNSFRLRGREEEEREI